MNGKLQARPDARIQDEPVTLEVTTRCGGRCRHCFVRASGRGAAELPREVAERVLAEAHASGYRHLHLTGGEPLAWQGLFPLLDHAAATGFERITLNTGGGLLSPALSRRLAACPGLSLSVSLDGPEALHDRIRGGGSFRRALRGLEAALAAGLRTVVFTTAGRPLLPRLPRFAEALFGEFPAIDRLTLIQLFAPAGSGFPLRRDLFDPGDYVVWVQTVSLLRLAGLDVRVKHSPLAGAVAARLGLPWDLPAAPLVRPGSLVVLADGEMALAHSSRDTFGRHAPGGIDRLLASAAYRRAVAPDRSACPACAHALRCGEHGMVRPWQGSGSPPSSAPFCRRVMDRLEGVPAAAEERREAAIQAPHPGPATRRHESTGGAGPPAAC